MQNDLAESNKFDDAIKVEEEIDKKIKIKIKMKKK